MAHITTGEIIGIGAGALLLVWLMNRSKSSVPQIPYNPNLAAQAQLAQAQALQAEAAASQQNALVNAGSDVLQSFLNSIF